MDNIPFESFGMREKNGTKRMPRKIYKKSSSFLREESFDAGSIYRARHNWSRVYSIASFLLQIS